MKNILSVAIMLGFTMCLTLGCASTSGAEKPEDTAKPVTPTENVDAGISPTEDEITQTITQFEGINREHAIAVWRVKRKHEEASAGYEAYWTLLQRSGENNQALLVDTLKTLKEAKELLDPVCKAYPNNQPLNSLSEAVMGDLHSLEARKK